MKLKVFVLLSMRNVSNVNTYSIFKINELLFLEAGFILLSTILTGVFVPFFGISFIFVSIATYFIYCFLSSMMSQYPDKFEDFPPVFSLDSFPKAKRNILACVGLAIVSVPVVLFYNQSFVAYPYNSTLCTIFSSLLGAGAYTLVNKDGKSFVMLSFFALISIPLVCVSLVIGSVLTLPLLYIFLYRKTQDTE